MAAFFLVSAQTIHRNMFYILLLVSIATIFRQVHWRGFASQFLVKVIIIYIFYQLLSISWSPIFSAEELFELSRKSLLVLCFLIISAIYLATYKRALLLWQLLVISATIGASLALLDHLTQDSAMARMVDIGRGRNPVQAATLYAIALIIAAYLWLHFSARQHKQRIFWFGCWVLLSVAIIYTQSRGALIAAIFAHITLLLVSNFVRYNTNRSINCSIYGICSVIGIFAVIIFFFILAYIFSDVGDWLQRADSFRFEIWHNALQIWQRFPIFGIGYRAEYELTLSNGQTIYQPHSIYVSALYYGGVLGLICLILLFASGFWALWCGYIAARGNSLQHNALYMALLANAVILFIVDYNILLVNADIEWLLFWLPLAGAISYRMRSEKEIDANIA